MGTEAARLLLDFKFLFAPCQLKVLFWVNGHQGREVQLELVPPSRRDEALRGQAWLLSEKAGGWQLP